jgi:hypothetical protein
MILVPLTRSSDTLQVTVEPAVYLHCQETGLHPDSSE